MADIPLLCGRQWKRDVAKKAKGVRVVAPRTRTVAGLVDFEDLAVLADLDAGLADWLVPDDEFDESYGEEDFFVARPRRSTTRNGRGG